MAKITINIGRVEALFLLVLTVYLLSSIFWPGSPTSLLLSVALLVLGGWVAIRLSKRFARMALWRLRNRLIAAYFFIGFVPLLLSVLLLGLGAYLVAGQLSIFLITSELQRQTAYLRGPVDFLSRAGASRNEPVVRFLERRYPGLQIQSAGIPSGWKDGHGLLVREGKLHGWAQVTRDGQPLLATFPITQEYLASLAPNLGETRMLSLARSATLHESESSNPTGIRNRLAPALNFADIVIFSTSAVPAILWENPAQTEEEYIAIFTRPSALLRTIVSERTSFASDWVTVTFYGVAILFLIALVIAVVVGISITQNVTDAVNALYEGTQRVTAGDFSHRIPQMGPDQLGALAASFNDMTRNLERLLRVEKERERLQNELEIAREVQNQLFPTTIPESDTIRISAVCNPARMVSGDFYDYQRLGPGRIALSVGDVAGKGISAALLMSTIQSSFRTQLRHCLGETAPAELVSQLNKQLHAFTAPEKYATFFYGVIDEQTSRLIYTNAGHLPPFLVRGEEVNRLETTGMVVGAFPFASYGEKCVALRPGDLLCFYTDGITEPENDYGEMYGEDRLADLLRRNTHLGDSDLLHLIVSSARQWSGAEELHDDMTVLLVRRS